MATIRPSDAAPSESVHYTFAGTEFDLGGSGKGSKKSVDIDDRAVLDNANVHPWLVVEYPAEASEPTWREQIAAADDPLAFQNSVAFDPEAIAAALPQPENDQPVAIQAGLDQDKTTDSDVDETVADTNTNTDTRKES